MSDDRDKEGVRGRITARGEDALGKLAQDLLENPLVNGAITRAFEAREKASQAQEVAMGAFNIPSASDIERLTRRLRSVSQRLEGIEDTLDRLEHAAGGAQADNKLSAIEAQLASLAEKLEALHPDSPAPMARGQERLPVDKR